MADGKSIVHKFNILNFGLSVGISFAVYLFAIAMLAWQFHWGTDLVEITGTWYKGYAPTPLGGLIGILWGFADGFIGGVFVSWIYNMLQSRKEKK